MKIAVILLNMGGPDSLNNVKPFLLNLFNDYAIIDLPQPFRWMVARLIVFFRLKKTQGIYSLLGGKSPIVDETRLQANALENKLKKNFDCKVFINMRYWHPLVKDVVNEVKEYNPDKIILLPLYPQYSTTTTHSSIKHWHKFAKKLNLSKSTFSIESYPIEHNFIEAYADLIEDNYKNLKNPQNAILLFSAHGIPIKRIKQGDPYQTHIEQTVAAVNKQLQEKGININHEICYQSKVGPLEWLSPATDDTIKKYANMNNEIIIVPIAFVSEHSETLVELDMDYKELAINEGAAGYYRVSTVRDHPKFIKGLAELCNNIIA